MNYVDPLHDIQPEVIKHSNEGLDFTNFHNREKPLDRHRKFEYPWHRAAIALLSTGYNIKDTAEMMGKSMESVRELARSPWAAERIASKIEKAEDTVMEAMRLELSASLNKIIELRDNPKVSPTVQLAASNTIMDRVLGKATNKIEVSQGPKAEDPVREAERLRQEISAGIERAAKL